MLQTSLRNAVSKIDSHSISLHSPLIFICATAKDAGILRADLSVWVP